MTPICTGQAPAPLSRAQFQERFQLCFCDPAFDGERQAPITRPAGRGFADPQYALSQQWLDTRQRLKAAQKVWADSATTSRTRTTP